VKEVIMDLNFSELCGFGIHQILIKRKIISPVTLTLEKEGFYWTETGLRIHIPTMKINRIVSNKVDVTDTGLVCGYISFTCNKVSFNSTSNIYLLPSSDFTKVPAEFHYIYVINKRAIYFDTIVYNRLLENSKKYIKILGLCVFDNIAKKYKIDISCFEVDKEIEIEEDLHLHTIDGLPFRYNNQMDMMYILNLQDEMYHNEIRPKAFLKTRYSKIN
jgi:hypothetical protein